MSVQGDSSPIPQEVLDASMKTFEAEKKQVEHGWPPAVDKTPSQHAALGSGFLNPVVPPTPLPRQTPALSMTAPVIPQMMTPLPSATQVPVQTSPVVVVAPPQLPPPPPAIPIELLQTIESLKQANFHLHEKFETAMSKLGKLEKDKSELLDRLEKTLLMAAKLKDIESDRNQVRDKLAETEIELRNLFNKKTDLENELRERTSALTSVRSKYFAEREVNEKLGEELKIVSTVSEIAKKEVENQISRNNLREVQLCGNRNIDDELEMAKTVYENALLKTSLGSKLTNLPDQPTSFGLPKYAEWRDVCAHVVSNTNEDEEAVRSGILSSSQSRVDVNVFDDRSVRVRMEAMVENSDSASLKFSITNVAPYIIQSVRLIGASRKFSTSPITLDPMEPVYLRPGQSVSVSGQYETSINSCLFPSVCVSYTGSGGIATNKYLKVPLCVTKFFTPMRPSASVVVDRWNSMSENQVQETFVLLRNEFKSLSEIVSACELGGNFSSVRSVDMNPRGCVFVAAWGAGKHGPVREIVTRVELGSADWPGPVMCRVTVRSSLITLSKSVCEILMTILK